MNHTIITILKIKTQYEYIFLSQVWMYDMIYYPSENPDIFVENFKI